MNRNKTLTLLIISQLIFVLLIIVWMVVAGLSIMMFDSPEAATHVPTWLFFLYIASYPIGVIAGIITGWVLFAKKRYKAALIWNSLPLLWIVPITILLLVL
ncbi:hypothetical protein FHS18_006023 [Paenibacillus phyllosphaerae]|uniref:Uncharacterized protein n=1 Tax=Paenibacillus phyllosphaerae TaxID=274593 RepID=A0A7W5FR24_9BACL|nr:hypothetical protein [Paenibacillus phyllosphaerae]MBB3113908.1 hypothetical protein [Paenibacillus phyllosphaerae]